MKNEEKLKDKNSIKVDVSMKELGDYFSSEKLKPVKKKVHIEKIKPSKKEKEKIKDLVIWKDEPEEHDYPAAEDYLELIFSKKKVNKLVDKLRSANITHKKAKDILRASNLPLLPKDNIHVKKNIDDVKQGKKMSPLLLVSTNDKLIIADGYHRISALYYLSEDLNIPCKLIHSSIK